jgi:hypothetical protein
MTRKLVLLSLISLITFQVFSQTENQKNESKTKVYKYKLKLQPIHEKVEIDYYNQNIQNEELFEYSVGNFNFDKGAYQESNMQLVKALKQDSTGEINAIENFKKANLKSLNNDSAKIEVYKNNEYNYSCLIIGNDTLIGIKNNNEPTISYYYLSKKGNFYYTTEIGSLLQLHSSQNVYSMPDLPFQISNHNFSVFKVKFLNKTYSSTSFLTNEINETSNLIYDFQYPSEQNSFPLQFNLLRNGNKYVFEMISEKELANSKAINKKVKFVNERKFEKLPLNELFQLVGFEY